MANIDGKGGFKKGISGNPGGRPKKLNEVKELAAAHTIAAIERLAFWLHSDNPKASISAANALLDRAWGKPALPVNIGDNEGEKFVVTLKINENTADRISQAEAVREAATGDIPPETLRLN